MAASIVSATAVSSASFGLTAEVGIMVENVQKSVGREKVEKQDEDGDTVLVSYFDPRATFNVDGVLIGVTGVGNAQVASLLTLANSGIGAGGVTTGNIYVDSVDYNGTNRDFKTISVSATQYPGIT